MGLFIFDIGVDLSNFGIFEEVVDADISIAGTIGNKGILGCKFGDHNLAFLSYVGFDS